jgi:hypothetical protein
MECLLCSSQCLVYLVLCLAHRLLTFLLQENIPRGALCYGKLGSFIELWISVLSCSQSVHAYQVGP